MASKSQKTEEKRLLGKEWNALVKEFKENNSFDKETLKGDGKEIKDKKPWKKEWHALVKEFKENNSFDKETLKGEGKEIKDKKPWKKDLDVLETDLEKTNLRINETIEEQVIETKAKQQCESKLHELNSNYQMKDKNQSLVLLETQDFAIGQTFNLDVDGDGEIGAFSDGFMILRGMLGDAFAGDALIDKAITGSAKRTTEEIHAFIQYGIDSGALDVDKDGTVGAFSDGFMILRKMFGDAFPGDALIDKAISPDSPYYGQENAAELIAQNIDALNTLI